MRAARPAAGSAHAAFHLGECLFDTDYSRLRFCTGGDPADPFITREWSDILPHCEHCRRGLQCLLKISRQRMYRTSCNRFLCHEYILDLSRYDVGRALSLWSECPIAVVTLRN